MKLLLQSDLVTREIELDSNQLMELSGKSAMEAQLLLKTMPFKEVPEESNLNLDGFCPELEWIEFLRTNLSATI